MSSSPRPRRSLIVRGLASLAVVGLASATALSGVQASPPPPVPDRSPVLNDTVKTSSGSTATTPLSAWNVVKYNRLYRTGTLGDPRCRAPRYPLNNAGNIKAWHLSFLYCLNNTWVHKIRGAKYRFAKPTLVIHTNGINSPCGFMGVERATYCAPSKGIYIGWKRYARLWSQDPTYVRAWATFVIAHEYGHHVQAMTGILAAQDYRQAYVHKTTAKRLEENRRMELQASCFSAAYVGANRRYYPMSGALFEEWRRFVKNAGDENNPPGAPRTHGSRSSHNFWSTRGWTYKSPYSCMTWSAGSSVVD